jgi:hypothetical protein
MGWWLFRSKAQEPEAERVEPRSPEGAPPHPEVARVLDLQRAVGNQALHGIVALRENEEAGHLSESTGEPLDAEVQKRMESRFDEDLSAVRVHVGARAAESAEALHAEAYTVGRDIYFAAGRYAPRTPEGERLLAHELAHTIQQDQGGQAGEALTSSGDLSRPDDPLEREAARASEPPREGERIDVTRGAAGAARGIQRQERKPPAAPEWQRRLDEILPRGLGLVAVIHRDMQLLELFGEAKLIELVNKIYVNPPARDIVRMYGVAGIVALDKTNLDVPKARDQLEPKVLKDFAVKFSAAADLIRASLPALKLIYEAAAAGATFGGYAEDGPGSAVGRAYTSGNAVYVPRTRTDAVMAMSDFLFELNNAIRAPKFAELVKEAAKGAAGTLTAREYAYRVVEQEVEGMLRLGQVWFEMKKARGTGAAASPYDIHFFLSDYNAFREGSKTKDAIVREVMRRVYETGTLRGKTVEQNYMEQYHSISGVP